MHTLHPLPHCDPSPYPAQMSCKSNLPFLCRSELGQGLGHNQKSHSAANCPLAQVADSLVLPCFNSVRSWTRMLELLVGELKVVAIWIEHAGCVVSPTRVVPGPGSGSPAHRIIRCCPIADRSFVTGVHLCLALGCKANMGVARRALPEPEENTPISTEPVQSRMVERCVLPLVVEYVCNPHGQQDLFVKRD